MRYVIRKIKKKNRNTIKYITIYSMATSNSIIFLRIGFLFFFLTNQNYYFKKLNKIRI